jgi:predicted metal-dependent phosphoesterase TrpH
MASDLGIAAIAITDHDTTDGVTAALRHGIPPSLQFLTGVEISADPPASFPGGGSLHILGYGIDCRHPDLILLLERLVASRRNRNPDIIRRLQGLGMDISLEEVAVASGECQLGRPHIARRMVQKGLVASMDEAFDRFLGAGKAAYVEKVRASCDEAIASIRAAGGIAVLAHPGLLPVTGGHQWKSWWMV